MSPAPRALCQPFWPFAVLGRSKRFLWVQCASDVWVHLSKQGIIDQLAYTFRQPLLTNFEVLANQSLLSSVLCDPRRSSVSEKRSWPCNSEIWIWCDGPRQDDRPFGCTSISHGLLATCSRYDDHQLLVHVARDRSFLCKGLPFSTSRRRSPTACSGPQDQHHGIPYYSSFAMCMRHTGTLCPCPSRASRRLSATFSSGQWRIPHEAHHDQVCAHGALIMRDWDHHHGWLWQILGEVWRPLP